MSAAEDNDAFEDSSIEVLHRDGRTLNVVAYLTSEGEEVAVADCVDAYVAPTEEELNDPGRAIMALLIKEILVRLKNSPQTFKAADFEFIRKLQADNSITFASVRRGDFNSTVATQVANEFDFPFPVSQPAVQ